MSEKRIADGRVAKCGEPPWKYSPKQLALELFHHLVYGAGVGVGCAGLDR
jgi:hypothetical protein